MAQRVVIVGAGIGGLTCAVALRQRGIEPAIYEAAPKLTVAGAGIWVPANAMQVMERLGLGDELTRAGLALTRIELAEGTRLLQQIDLARVIAKYGHGTVSIHRAELQRVLVEHLPQESIHTGKRCERVTTHDGGAVMQLSDGSCVDADVLIGADGIHSAVRRSLFGDQELRYSGQTCYRGIAKLSLGAGMQTVCRETWGGSARFGFSAIDAEHVYWFAPITAPAGEQDGGSPKQKLREVFAHFPAPIPEIVEATPSDAISRLDIHDLPLLDSWHSGPVVLLGDAAHATTPNMGQGGAQAIEDAWVLAKCLADEPAIDQAFASYEKIRMAKARRVVRTSWTFGKAAHVESGPLRLLRNMMLLGTPDALATRQLDELYALDF